MSKVASCCGSPLNLTMFLPLISEGNAVGILIAYTCGVSESLESEVGILAGAANDSSELNSSNCGLPSDSAAASSLSCAWRIASNASSIDVGLPAGKLPPCVTSLGLVG